MKVLVADSNLVPHRERLEAALPPGVDVVWRIGQDPQAVRDELRDADVYVGGRFTADMADAAEKLRLLHVVGAGTDRVDFNALPDTVLVANTFHHERSIAEYVLSAAIMLRRDFLAQDRARDVACGRRPCMTTPSANRQRCGMPASASSASATSANAPGSCSASSAPRARQ